MLNGGCQARVDRHRVRGRSTLASQRPSRIEQRPVFRGPTLLEDFIMREKITHFDHERIPERIVHARGSGAHGVFHVYDSMAKVTKAKFLQDPSRETPVFVRFSTVAGSRGSTDIACEVGRPSRASDRKEAIKVRRFAAPLC